MLDWLIVGGGPHGRYVAAALSRAAPEAEVAVLDPQPSLAAWTRRAGACGMAYLRSSGAHHLGPRAGDLRRFANAHGYDTAHWLGYYRRPSRALFEAHARAALAGLPAIADHAVAVEAAGRGWRVHTQAGTAYRAARVVLATGPNPPYRPTWGADAEHVYDSEFVFEQPGERVAVIGGGITGAQLALRFRDTGRRVFWVTHDAPRTANFDSDPCYAGRRCLKPLMRRPMRQRTELLAAARQSGTLPPDIMAQITAALAAGDIAWRRGEVIALDESGLVFAEGGPLAARRIVLTTGFNAWPAPDSLLAECIQRLHLEQDRDGHLLIDDALQAAPGLHTVGRPASLQLGPMAGNIRGARLAGERIAALASAESALATRRA